MLTLLHISDLHFGPPYIEAVGEALLRFAGENASDIIVASGDFTQRAKPEQFAAARAFLDRLPAAPLVVVPGNHDIPLYRVKERLFTPYALYQQYISPELEMVLRHPDAVIVALNTTSPLRAITNGRIRSEQLDFCSQAFRDAPVGTARIWWPITRLRRLAISTSKDAHVMPRAKEALDRFTELEVDLILGGHLHRAYIGNSLDLYSSKDRSSGIIIVQSGTSTSQRGRGREREKTPST